HFSHSLTTCLLLFLSYSSVALRSLSSFPTRRSSDLIVRRACLAGGLRRPGQRANPAAQRMSCNGQCAAARHAGQLAPDGRQGRRDRKSTRLNSSHEWTSYAVFCLKQTKTPVTERHT